eukprot:TRINITY_DN4185_c0_g1_i1.p1 TRINITY_DN4185_c0_g1~~TRINITY_DN4185_c0_g1_i1.p1  ORF type:complete len:348 (-),score=32.02 TRINITY_DN4185_c0_g1_i1:100-1143(-)
MGLVYFTSVSLTLFIMYSFVAIAVGFQLSRILYYRHNLLSFQFGFLLIGFIWSLLRSIFWGLFPIVDQVTWGITVLLWIPVNFEFATFSLLVLFFAHLVNKTTWEKIKNRYVVVFAGINIILLILQCVWIGFAISTPNADFWFGFTQSILTASVFLILIVILAIYGWKLHKVMKTSKLSIQAQIPPQILQATFVIFILFTSRFAWNVATIVGQFEVSLDSDAARDKVIIVTGYFLWEIAPTVLVLFLFWRIPRTNPRGRQTLYTFPQTPTRARFIPSSPYLLSQEKPSSVQKSGSFTSQPLLQGYSVGKNSAYSTTPLPYNAPQSVSEPSSPSLERDNERDNLIEPY